MNITERKDHKLAPFDDHTKESVWINHVSIVMSDVSDRRKILNALSAFRGTQMTWTSSLGESPQSWENFVKSFRAFFIEGTEQITDIHRLIRKVREVKKWDKEELIERNRLPPQQPQNC